MVKAEHLEGISYARNVARPQSLKRARELDAGVSAGDSQRSPALRELPFSWYGMVIVLAIILCLCYFCSCLSCCGPGGTKAPREEDSSSSSEEDETALSSDSPSSDSCFSVVVSLSSPSSTSCAPFSDPPPGVFIACLELFCR